MKHVASILSLLFLSSSFLGAGAANADATIVFCSNRDGPDGEIYVMDADGSNVRRLTDNTSNEELAACSPDGRWVAFVTDRDGNNEIYVMEIDGGAVLRLTNHPASDLFPAWSRDGTMISFNSDRDGDQEIYVMNSDGTGLQQVTNNTGQDGLQNFHPDGTRFVFHSDRGGNVDIWTIGVDGSSPQQLTNTPFGDYMPAYSPDGTQIVFESDRHGPLELYTMNADGSNVQRLTFTNTDNHEPDWSPDGSQVVFVSNQGGDYDVAVVNPDGTGFQILTLNSGIIDWGVSWRPEVISDSLNGGGTGALTYTYQPISVPGNHEIFTIRLDGTAPEKVIDAQIGLNHQEWSPDGQQFACVGYVNQWTWAIHKFNADGTALLMLTYAFGLWDNEPSFSPDGTRIAWSRIYPNENYRGELWMMNANGTDQHYIGAAGDMPNWSPDGTRLVYHSGISDADIWTCNPDGTDPQQLTFLLSDDSAPDWSPDGSKIAFVSNRDGNYEIYVMNPNGSGQRRLTNTAVDEYSPRWSPDGSRIAFTSGPHLEWEVFVMDSTGADVRRVTYSPPGVTGINPDWQPRDSTQVPIFLAGFSARADASRVRFAWAVVGPATATDFRLLASAGGRERPVAVEATGARTFEAVDEDPSLRAGGEVVYRLLTRADDGGWDLLRTETVTLMPPHAGAWLVGVHPNPFNPHTTVSFIVAVPQPVRIDVHNAAGRRVATLVERDYPAGDHRVQWDGRNDAGSSVSSGIYFLRFVAQKSIETRELVLVR